MAQWRYILKQANDEIVYRYVSSTSGVNFPEMLHHGEAILATLRGRPIGIMSFKTDESTDPVQVRFTAVEVKSKWRRMGIGTQLQREFVNYLNGKYGPTGYMIKSVATSEGGSRLVKYRKTLLADPEQQDSSDLIFEE